MTQADVAKKLGITRSSVNAWEMGISVPSTMYLVLRCINNCELNSQWNPCICPTECMRSKVVLLNEASDTFLQLIYGCVALPF